MKHKGRGVVLFWNVTGSGITLPAWLANNPVIGRIRLSRRSDNFRRRIKEQSMMIFTQGLNSRDLIAATENAVRS